LSLTAAAARSERDATAIVNPLRENWVQVIPCRGLRVVDVRVDALVA
jgi:hypothetical protein